MTFVCLQFPRIQSIHTFYCSKFGEYKCTAVIMTCSLWNPDVQHSAKSNLRILPTATCVVHILYWRSTVAFWRNSSLRRLVSKRTNGPPTWLRIQFFAIKVYSDLNNICYSCVYPIWLQVSWFRIPHTRFITFNGSQCRLSLNKHLRQYDWMKKTLNQNQI